MKQQTYTFAAICQVAKLVQTLARTGQVDDDALKMLLNSILITSPSDPLDVYGGNTQALNLGLTTLTEQLGSGNQAKDPELTRYLVSLLALERKLTKSSGLMAQLGERIEQAKRQTEHYDITSETLLASLASIYSDVISPAGTRIQIAGEPSILKQNIIQHKVRALLLAGIRSAVLWRQVGGQRRNLLFSRKKILSCAEAMLN